MHSGLKDQYSKFFLCIVAVVAVATIAILLCGCERGPTEEDMAENCASHRTPTWGDVIDCKAAGREQAK